MLIRVPILLDETTAVEGVSASTFESPAVINTDRIVYFHPDMDEGQTICTFSGGELLIVCLNMNDFEELLDRYEITVYEN